MTLDEFHRLKWPPGGVAVLFSVWTLFHPNADACTLLLLSGSGHNFHEGDRR